jgi:hypothetical protein
VIAEKDCLLGERFFCFLQVGIDKLGHLEGGVVASGCL